MTMVNATLPSRNGETIAVLVEPRLRLRLRRLRLRRLRLGLFEEKVEEERKS